ncbi:hypothetical protein BK126_03050 [Paenibacillus sp. FSL H7-0326]|uniref:hypothetical protein n=1 Tax=Paenibacillus sp. FSL H7-0326 TaxID=1921144 RepID=UPI00096C70DE|nr:hypothetical protein [Paenibacillus sp. FSL H7-0326]OMC71105.1 hypothetical protein BK126_03050 [Paenibacillus sp. FSL H7-0326]
MIKIHGVKFYGVYKQEQKKALFDLARVTTKEEWRGVKAVYCSQSRVDPPYTNIRIASYVKVVLKGRDAIKSGFDKKVGELCLSPIIYIEGSVLTDEINFLFNILHELGHHNQKHNRLDINPKVEEINAHIFAMIRLIKKHKSFTLKPYYYLAEACEALNLSYSSDPNAK